MRVWRWEYSEVPTMLQNPVCSRSHLLMAKRPQCEDSLAKPCTNILRDQLNQRATINLARRIVPRVGCGGLPRLAYRGLRTSAKEQAGFRRRLSDSG